MGQMAIQGVIYNKAMWAGLQGGLMQEPGVTGQAKVLFWGPRGGITGSWALGRVKSGFTYSGGGESRAVVLSLWVATFFGGIIYQISCISNILCNDS